MGVSDRYYIFFNELGLEYGNSEINSFKTRNVFTHGDNIEDYLTTIQTTRVMFILLGRIILKLLEYDGEYIDESVPGFSKKHIDNKIGE